MALYNYLISSLPMIGPNSEMPFTYEKFLDLCVNCVDSEEYEILKNLTIHSNKGPLLKEWHEWNSALYSELNYERSLKLKKKCEPPVFRNEQTTKFVNELITMENPLDAEKKLLMYQFNKLDELIGTHNFDVYYLNGYALKLKLMERLNAFSSEKGRIEFNRLFDNIQNQIRSI